MNTHVFQRIGGLALGLVLLGAGCGNAPMPAEKDIPHATPVNLREMSPADAAKNVNLVPGSTITLEQAFVGFGADVDFRAYAADATSSRVLIVDRFAPQVTANVTWKQSRVIRENGEDQLETLAANTDGFNLNDSPQLFLPSFWEAEEHGSSFGTSGIWIARERFEGLDRTRVGTLNPSFHDQALQRDLRKNAQLKPLFDRLGAEMKTVENRTDVFLAKAEQDPISVPLMVNGEEIAVDALRVTTWFGEFLILNNPQNPLILSFSFRDRNEDGSLRFTGADTFKRFVDYTVVSLADTAL